MKKKTKKKTKKYVRASKSFFDAASGAEVGQNIAGRIMRARGRGNAPITKNTVTNWKNAGLVDIPTYSVATAFRYKIVRLTKKGRALLENAAAWRSK